MAGYRFLQEEAYAHIKEQIVTGSLAEDQIYSETKLAAAIGISPHPGQGRTGAAESGAAD